MIIKRVLTNNAVVVEENGIEKIACGKGIAFKKKPGMKIDVSRRMLYRGKKEVKATSVEFQILHLLARNPGRVFSKEQIYDIVWKEPYSGDHNIVMSHIRNIRKNRAKR